MISEAAARRFWPGENPVGKQLRVHVNEPSRAPREIVGIVGDVRTRGMELDPVPVIYVAHTQYGPESMTVVVRAGGDPIVLLPQLKSTLRALGPGVAIGQVQSMEDRVSANVAEPRFRTLLLNDLCHRLARARRGRPLRRCRVLGEPASCGTRPPHCARRRSGRCVAASAARRDDARSGGNRRRSRGRGSTRARDGDAALRRGRVRPAHVRRRCRRARPRRPRGVLCPCAARHAARSSADAAVVNSQLPTPNSRYSRLPTPKVYLGIGNWELGVGIRFTAALECEPEPDLPDSLFGLLEVAREASSAACRSDSLRR